MCSITQGAHQHQLPCAAIHRHKESKRQMPQQGPEYSIMSDCIMTAESVRGWIQAEMPPYLGTLEVSPSHFSWIHLAKTGWIYLTCMLLQTRNYASRLKTKTKSTHKKEPIGLGQKINPKKPQTFNHRQVKGGAFTKLSDTVPFSTRPPTEGLTTDFIYSP